MVIGIALGVTIGTALLGDAVTGIAQAVACGYFLTKKL
jgi:hypothetical protein